MSNIKYEKDQPLKAWNPDMDLEEYDVFYVGEVDGQFLCRTKGGDLALYDKVRVPAQEPSYRAYTKDSELRGAVIQKDFRRGPQYIIKETMDAGVLAMSYNRPLIYVSYEEMVLGWLLYDQEAKDWVVAGVLDKGEEEKV